MFQTIRTDGQTGILEHVLPSKVTNASPLVWQRLRIGYLRLCVVNFKIATSWTRTAPDMEMIFHNLSGASYFGKTDLSDANCQTELDDEAKDIWTINIFPRLLKLCQPPQKSKNSSSIFQNCIESTLEEIKWVMFFAGRCVG